VLSGDEALLGAAHQPFRKATIAESMPLLAVAVSAMGRLLQRSGAEA